VTARLVGTALEVRHGSLCALDGVSIELHAQELVALVGPNGSGKSTLLRTLLGAQRPTSGAVALDGTPLSSIPPRTRARTLTMVVEGSSGDFAMRVRDLVALGRIPFEGRLGGSSREDVIAVEDAMAVTDVLALADRTIDTLSAGELQRVHVARAFAQKASIVLLDEPTANLDVRHQLETIALLRAFVDGGGAAMIALHDLSLAARTCDRVVVLRRGRVYADGPPASVLVAELLAEVFEVKARVGRDAVGAVDYILAFEPLPTSASTKGSRP
jgi:iron complex transport system ATP-binding protein